jgi:S-adenosylmethionine decarboxylase
VLVHDDARSPELRPTGEGRMQLRALDVWVRDVHVLTDLQSLRATLYSAARAGRATVVGESFHVFPNRALTGVLVLAQSHLSIHTWPEYLLANVDLLSYGAVDGEEVLRVVADGLGAERSELTSIERARG